MNNHCAQREHDWSTRCLDLKAEIERLKKALDQATTEMTIAPADKLMPDRIQRNGASICPSLARPELAAYLKEKSATP
jgi:hypothetical protein